MAADEDLNRLVLMIVWVYDKKKKLSANAFGQNNLLFWAICHNMALMD